MGEHQRHLKETITEINSTFTFMSPGLLRNSSYTIGYSMCVRSGSKPIYELGNSGLERVIRPDVRSIYERRNKISHQTDIEHGGSDRNAITFDEVKHYRDIIVHTVESIYQSV